MTPSGGNGRRRTDSAAGVKGTAGKGSVGKGSAGKGGAGQGAAGRGAAGARSGARSGAASGARRAAGRGAVPGARRGTASGSGQPGRSVAAHGRDAPRSRRDTMGASLAPSRSSDRRRARSEAPELGGDQIEGRHAVRELLAAARRPVTQVWVADGLDPAPILDEITALAAEAGVPVRVVNGTRLRQMAATDAPQGVIANAEPLEECELDELVAGSGGQTPFLVVMDGLTDPHNLGALLRTAQCAGATGAILPRHRSAHITATVAKAAAGAIEYLPMAVVPGIPSALARLVDAGVWTVGLDADSPMGLWSLSVATEPIAIVLGAEGAGLSRLAKARCQLLVAIPQAGPIASLNVAAAGALACFEVSRARLAAAPTS